jgi:hypothetical protein
MLNNVRETTCKIIRDLELPVYDLAGLAGIPGARLSDYRAGRPLPRMTEVAIENTTRDVEFVWRVLGGGEGYFRTDLKDHVGFRKALAVARNLHNTVTEEQTREAELARAAEPIASA